MKALSPLSNAAITPEESEHVDSWTVPNVESRDVQDEGKTNALGKSRSWRYEPPEETEVAEPAPLTAEEIEEIRQAAFDEGFEQGKADGFAKGFEEGRASGHQEATSKGLNKV